MSFLLFIIFASLLHQSPLGSPLEPPAAHPARPSHRTEDLLCDGARVAALLDIRQMIGARSEPQAAGSAGVVQPGFSRRVRWPRWGSA